MEIRKIQMADAEMYRSLRLEGLKKHPEAFEQVLKKKRNIQLIHIKKDCNHQCQKLSVHSLIIN
ncbi:hypothetical protein J2S17_003407 [Cytobacillus purgationiresistens]|uniref:Uncharacterized protein n=1 Tax=Cytobacillus purgationiresistens TaxID=863449 RepID=A0ABU0AKV6_9BACI|nr:hypothetical protein [Cytobacillus purgationiresistens]